MTSEVNGFIRASGEAIVNGEGRELLLRGVGLGSWLLPEGYMWRFPEQGDRPRRMERMVSDLLGEEKAELFWETYYHNYITEKDIEAIAAEGFNSIRLPINARFLLGEDEPLRLIPGRIEVIDSVIAWCRKHSLYVILDLHGAPGGQTGTNIDDSEHNKPELFIMESCQRLTVELWRVIAERYKEEWIVAGYDLLNEPLPNWFSEYNHLVMPLYRQIIQAIREVDERHMIILEGVHWATDWSIFDEKPDDNLMLQFHKYWSNPDMESIQAYLDMRKAWNAPIFMGEGGENNCDWYAGVFRLYEDHRISWNFWTWKKMDCTNSPCSVTRPSGWQLLVDYLEGGEKPDAAVAERILFEYAGNLLFERCSYHGRVVNALFRRPSVRIPAVFYGYEGIGKSFGIQRPAEQRINFRVNDGTDLRFVSGQGEKPNYQHYGGEEWTQEEWLYVHLAAEDWLAYEFTGPSGDSVTARLELIVRVSGQGAVALFLDDEYLGIVEPEGDTWQNVVLQDPFEVKAGTHRLELRAKGQPVSLQWITLNKL